MFNFPIHNTPDPTHICQLFKTKNKNLLCVPPQSSVFAHLAIQTLENPSSSLISLHSLFLPYQAVGLSFPLPPLPPTVDFAERV